MKGCDALAYLPNPFPIFVVVGMQCVNCNAEKLMLVFFWTWRA